MDYAKRACSLVGPKDRKANSLSARTKVCMAYKRMAYNSMVYNSMVYNNMAYKRMVYKRMAYNNTAYNNTWRTFVCISTQSAPVRHGPVPMAGDSK